MNGGRRGSSVHFGVLRGDVGGEEGGEVLDAHALLLHRIAVAEGDGALVFGAVFSDGIKIDRDAERGADFVLATVAATDGAGFIVIHTHGAAEDGGDAFGFRNQLGAVF